jgi:tRNA/tmRNA/rRNA uracil-C5-methylase (TrmA/RlmC/RlmD family)
VHCPHRPPCPGCPRFGANGLAPDAFQALVALTRDAALPPPEVVEGPAHGYRLRARLAIRGRPGSPKIGIFQEGSHRIVDIPRCVVHHPLVNEVAAAVKTAVRRTGVSLYADTAHRGCLRYLQVVVERASNTAQVVLVANDETPDGLAPTADALAAELGPRLHSLWWNGNTAHANTILGERWHRWSGPEAVCESIGGARVFYPPGAFGQANLPLADRLTARVHGWVPDDVSVVELHAGVGAIGLGLVSRTRHVIFNEISAAGRAGLALGLAALVGGLRERTSVLPGLAEDHLDALTDADVVICDPPRRGLAAPLLARLAESPPPRLVLVSCNLEAFLREARVLLDSGHATLAALTAFVLVPFTDHVETVALFTRR